MYVTSGKDIMDVSLFALADLHKTRFRDARVDSAALAEQKAAAGAFYAIRSVAWEPCAFCGKDGHLEAACNARKRAQRIFHSVCSASHASDWHRSGSRAPHRLLLSSAPG